MSTLPISSIAALTPQTASPTGSSSATQASSNLATQSTFLQLLVSQIKNQDPLNPADPVQFLSQLTSYSQLEQLMQINQELAPQATTGNPADASSTNPVS